jgi:uncharacterized membrane protein HdeD (DUF308 family)
VTTAQTDPAEAVGVMGRSRAWIITFGVLTLIAGLLVLFWPGATVLVLAVIFAIQLIIIGIYRLVLAIAASEDATGARVFFGIIGVLSIVVGILCLRAPLQTVIVLGLLLGLIWTITGIVEIVHAFTGEKGSSRWWLLLSGLLSVIAGIILIVYPGESLVVLAWVMGVLFVVYGIIMIIQGFMTPKAAT